MFKRYLIFGLLSILLVSFIGTGCSSKTGGTTTTTTTSNINTNSPISTTVTPRTTTTAQTASTLTTTSTTVTTQTTSAVKKAWHLSEVQVWDDYQGVKAPYHISWIGNEGDVVSTVTVESPYNPVSSINAKWTIPPETLVPGSEYQMEFSVTAINQNTASLGLEGSITSALDIFNQLPNGRTGSRIDIIPADNYPRIRWNDANGTVKSGQFTLKAPEYGFADSTNTNKMTLTVRYYSSAILAWRYIYEWTDKDITPVRTDGIPTTQSPMTTALSNISGNWTGTWTNSLGESGNDTLQITVDKSGNLQGVWSGNINITGQWLNNTNIRFSGQNSTRSYQVQGSVLGNTLILYYTATRLNTSGTYTGIESLTRVLQ